MTKFNFFVENPITLNEWCSIFESSLENLLNECNNEEKTIIYELSKKRINMEKKTIVTIDSILLNIDKMFMDEKDKETFLNFTKLESVYNKIFGEDLTIKLYDLIDTNDNNLNGNDLAKIERTIRVLSVVRYYLTKELCNTSDLIEHFQLKRRTIQEYLHSPIINFMFEEEVVKHIEFKKVISEIIGNRKGGHVTSSIKINRPRSENGRYMKESI